MRDFTKKGVISKLNRITALDRKWMLKDKQKTVIKYEISMEKLFMPKG